MENDTKDWTWHTLPELVYSWTYLGNYRNYFRLLENIGDGECVVPNRQILHTAPRLSNTPTRTCILLDLSR